MSKRRSAAVAGLAVVMWWTVATPAVADSAGPSNYLSEVTGIDPEVDGLDVEVVGGDSFLVVTAGPGTVVEVPGYEGEPYVRIGADGVVTVNRNSPAFWVNDDRFGQVPLPATADAGAEPDWMTVSESGSYGWHDHRIHWMSPRPPPAVDQSSRSLVQEWTVPLVVDGVDVAVTGDLQWLPSVSPFPWLVAIAAVGALLVWRRAAIGGLVVGSGLAVAVGVAQVSASPLGIWAEALAWVPPVVALAAAVTAAVTHGGARVRLLAFGGVVVAVWAIVRISSLWLPVLPTALPAALERAAVAAALAAGGAALIGAYKRLTGSNLPRAA